jgi:hypothetical protein
VSDIDDVETEVNNWRVSNLNLERVGFGAQFSLSHKNTFDSKLIYSRCFPFAQILVMQQTRT